MAIHLLIVLHSLQITPQILDNFAKFLNSKEEKTIILGCTELPVLYDLCKEKVNKNIVDPAEVVLNMLREKFCKKD